MTEEMEKNFKDLEELYKLGMLDAEGYAFQKKQLEEEMARESGQAASTPPPDSASEAAGPPLLPEMPKIHVSVEGKKIGEFEREEVIKKIQAGEINRDARVWKKGMPDWVDAGSLPELEDHFGPPPDMAEEKKRVLAEKQAEEARLKREREEAEARIRADAEKRARIAMQEKAAAETRAQGEFDKDLMVHVPGGSFQMGDTAGGGVKEERPVHTVTLSAFFIGKYEVTQAQYQAVMGNNPSQFKGGNLPVECVSWYDAIEFCNKLSEREGLQPAYAVNGENVDWNRNADGYRLPTEAEWEYAAKGGNGSPGNYKYAGSNDVNSVAWYRDNSGKTTHAVGTKAPNGLGIYDMSGNVNEWCWDLYEKYLSGTQTNPVGASSGSYHVWRGGSWGLTAQSARSAWRNNGVGDPDSRIPGLGFRVLRS